MSRNRTYRPRTTRENRERLKEVATQLNGTEPAEFHESLSVLLDYLDVLNGSVACSYCGEKPIDSIAHGTWKCWYCEEYTEIYDVLGTDEPDSADIPLIPRQ